VTLVAGTGIAITGAGGAAGSLTIASTAAGGATTPVAWGTLTVPATPGSLINIYVGGTAPSDPAVQLVARGGTLPSTFATTNMMMVSPQVGTVTPPNAALLGSYIHCLHICFSGMWCYDDCWPVD
jgi:hypothetical protein